MDLLRRACGLSPSLVQLIPEHSIYSGLLHSTIFSSTQEISTGQPTYILRLLCIQQNFLFVAS